MELISYHCGKVANMEQYYPNEDSTICSDGSLSILKTLESPYGDFSKPTKTNHFLAM